MTRSDLFRGRYLFHFHTRLTDGAPSVEEYFAYARSERVDQLIFLEHIRRSPTYDVAQFAGDILKGTKAFGIDAALGFEAKLIPHGGIDIDEEDFQLAQVIGIAEHGFPKDTALLEQRLREVVALCRSLDKDKILVWVHPGLTFQKSGLQPSDSALYRSMLNWAQQEGVWIEKNLRYNLVPEPLVQMLNSDEVILGADAHRIEDCQAWRVAMASPVGSRV